MYACALEKPITNTSTQNLTLSTFLPNINYIVLFAKNNFPLSFIYLWAIAYSTMWSQTKHLEISNKNCYKNLVLILKE